MNGSNTLILISGPAASGKTTVVKKLVAYYKAKMKKPADCYIDIAKERGIPIEKAFTGIKREEAEDRFCKICKENPMIIGDQHLAIQFKRDSMMAVSNEINDDKEEEYTPAISKEFIEKLQKNGVNVVVLLLYASPGVLLERAKQRYKDIGHTVRNQSIEEVKREVEAERKFFATLMRENHLEGCEIRTDTKTEQEVYLDALRKTVELGRKKASSIEWTR